MVKNCRIEGGYAGVNIASNLPSGFRDALQKVSKDEAFQVGEDLQ